MPILSATDTFIKEYLDDNEVLNTVYRDEEGNVWRHRQYKSGDEETEEWDG